MKSLSCAALRRLSFGIAVGVALFAQVAPADEPAPDARGLASDQQLSDPIYGKALSAKDLNGRVVFFEYWGTDCPPCRASFPSLVQMQDKFGRTGKFQLIASHVQDQSAATLQFLNQQRVNFPVYQQLRIPKAPLGKGIPHAYLFDHKGQVIASGHPSELYGLVARAVAAAPPPPESDLTEMLIGVEVSHLKPLAMKLEPGREIKFTLDALQRYADDKKPDEKSEEAKAIIASVRAWISKRLAEAEALIPNQPSRAFSELSMLSTTLRGLPEGAEAAALLEPLLKDPAVRELARLREDAERLQAQLDDARKADSNQRFAAALRQRFDQFLAKTGLAENVRKEAETLRDSLPGA